MNERYRRIKYRLGLVAALALLLYLPTHTLGQENDRQASEVYLTFQYQGVVGVYITAYYQNDKFYLPVSELLSALKIHKEVKPGSLSITGNYLDEASYYFNFRSGNPRAGAGDKEIKLRADDYLIKEVDYFVRPYIFEELFGLNFTVDYNNLMLQLETEDKMPVVAQYEREQKRKQLNRAKLSFSESYYPLKYNRNYSTLDGAILDYNISSIYSSTSRLITLNNSIGAEVLGGDVQGSLFGALSDQQQSFRTNNLRWRYVRRNSDFLSNIIAGQTNSEGIANRSITGIKISNKPVEPRRLFDRYIINGQTVPESEVELYLNNQLVDYQTAGAGGNYRFLVPLTYGNTNYSVRIFTPGGAAIEENTRIQIPFEYLPPGAVDYTATLGKLENNILGSDKKGYQASATLSSGLSKWLTAQVSTEYLSEFHDNIPSFTATLNSRLFSKYLLNISANSENFYRFVSSVVYSNGTSWSASYDYNPGNSQLYNIGGNDHQARLNIFKPFSIAGVPLNVRLFTNFIKNGPTEFLRYRTDLNTRFGRLNLRIGYQDQQLTPLSLEPTSSARLSNSFTYTISRRSQLPNFFDDMFIRGRLSYYPVLNEMEEVEFQLSKDLWGTSRAQLSFNHNFRGDVSSVGLNFTLDFNKIRSNTAIRATGSHFSFSQGVRGSIAYDSYGNQFILNNRQQTGQAGAAVRLYVDNNNDGNYQESVDDVINDPAVRVDRAGGRTRVKDGVNYIDQLLPYYRYNMEINRSALSNPLLIPETENFSFITDPNQFKPIEIPFYLSGVIDGFVKKVESDSIKTGVAGLKLYLRQKNGDFTKEIRTFSDGSFYAYEIPPGEYTLSADSSQLEILGTISTEHSKSFEIESRAQGDFITGLQFELKSRSEQPEQFAEQASTDQPALLYNLFNDPSTIFEIQLAQFDDKEQAQQAARQAHLLFNLPHRIKYNRSNDQYVLRSYPVENADKALDRLSGAINSPFTNAALVITRDDLSSPVAPSVEAITTYRIQLGAFSNKRNALSFMEKVKRELGEQVKVTYEEDQALYKIQTQTDLSKSKTLAKLEKIKRRTSYNDSFITKVSELVPATIDSKEISATYSYNILIRGVTPQTQTAYLSAVTEESDVDINQSPKKDLLIFEDIPNWQKAMALKQKLSQISTIGQPVIVLIEKEQD